MQKHFKLKDKDIFPLEEMMITREEYRFTVLTDSMIRIEYSPEKKFVDEPTKVVINRRFPKVEYKLNETDKQLEIITQNVHLIFLKEKGGFTSHNLSVEVIGNFSSYHSKWYYGQNFETLKGTARTLDFADGSIPLEEGLMNDDGYSIIDDSETFLIDGDGWIKDKHKDHIDLYFLGYGRNYLETLKDYFHLTGYPPLIPRYAFGNWWSRYYPYSEESYKELIEMFEESQIPFSVAVIDMDWHLTEIPFEYGSGWTGYTWDRELFPNPQRFLDWLHDKELKTSLNLHPSNGIQPHEEAYEEFAEFLGMNPEEKQGIPFNITDKDFFEGYFKILHHPHEEMGIDFWWVDWQQGEISNLDGVDPLWMLNHYHYLDHGRDGKRPLIFSRYAGLGSHRYPLGFSGDSITTWDSLDFQPYFTATASNVGYTWWSHDIGGHMRGSKDNELYIRWMQYGVFSPINRLHSTGGKYNGKEPWRYGIEAESIVSKYLRLRHQLVPYLYTMNVLTNKEGLPLIQPIYYHHPWDKDAYSVKNQYYFGTELIVSPITTPLIKNIQRSHVKTWLPVGDWFDVFTGIRYQGDRLIDMYRTLNLTPVFAKAGSIVPLNKKWENSTENPTDIQLNVYPGGNGTFTLYEDSGEKLQFDGCETKINYNWLNNDKNESVLTIEKPRGNTAVLPERRTFSVFITGIKLDAEVEVTINDEIHHITTKRKGNGSHFELPIQNVMSQYQIRLKGSSLQSELITNEIEKLLDESHIGFDLKEELDTTIFSQNSPNRIVSELLAMDIDINLVKGLTELLLADYSS